MRVSILKTTQETTIKKQVELPRLSVEERVNLVADRLLEIIISELDDQEASDE